MNRKKFRKNSKAISPVVAEIILIAVTVAVSVVVAAWMSGMTIGLTGNAEKASITNEVALSTSAVQLTVQNTGSSTVIITSATIDGLATNVTSSATISILKGTSQTFSITAVGLAMTPTAEYTITLQTAKGNTITGQITYSP